MSDRICIMREGQIIQSGSPRELYDEPVNRYVADFVGKTNFFNGKVVTANKSSISINSESCAVLVGAKSKGAPTPKIGSNACVAVRPEMISISAADEKDNHADIAIKGHVKNRIFLGEHSEYLIVTEGFGDVLVLSPKTNESNRRIFAPGDHVSILVLEDT